MNFIALDVETANADMSSICAIGLVHFKDGQVFKDLSMLIDPEDHFDAINISIHGIRPEDVAGKPTIKTVYPALLANLDACVVVHHTHFDKTAMRQVAAKHGFPELTCHWLDSARIARRAWKEFATSGYGLADISAAFNIEFQHHQAAEDARCAGLITLRAIADTGLTLQDWLSQVEQPVRAPKNTSKSKSFYKAERITLEGNPEGLLFGEVIAFTGQLTIDRAEAAEIAAAAGCVVGGGVTKKTTILVVGDQDIRVLNGHDKSAKHRKAEQLIASGTQIRIICETDFRALVAKR